MLSVPVNKCKRGFNITEKFPAEWDGADETRDGRTKSHSIETQKQKEKKKENKKERQRLSCELNCCGGRTEPADRLTDAVPSSNSWPFVTRSQAPRPPSNCLLQLV